MRSVCLEGRGGGCWINLTIDKEVYNQHTRELRFPIFFTSSLIAPFDIRVECACNDSILSLLGGPFPIFKKGFISPLQMTTLTACIQGVSPLSSSTYMTAFLSVTFFFRSQIKPPCVY